MANQDWETKFESEMRIVRRLPWKIRGQTGRDPKSVALIPALNLLLP
jgi:hypothetical protein